MQSGAREVAEGFHELIQRSPGARQYLWVGSGWREPSGKNDEHGTGRAIDVIVTADTGMMPTPAERAAGNAFVDWLISHADELKIKGIIFSQDSAPRPEFWGYTHPGSWRSGEDRGSISANHVDHVHVFLKEGTAWPASLDSTKISVRPGLPNVGVDNGSGPHLVDSVSVSHLREARYTDPEKDGTPVGPYGDEGFTLETALARTEWLQSQYVDGHHRTSTAGGRTHRRRLMEHIIHPRTDARTRRKILDVPLDHFEFLMCAQSRDIFLIARRQIVEHAHAMPHREQRFT